MSHLENLDRADRQRAGDVRLRVGGQQRIDRPEGDEEHDRVIVRIGSRRAGPVGPEHPHDQPPEPEALARPCEEYADTPVAGCLERGVLVGALVREAGIEDRVHAGCPDDVGGPADMVTLRMRQNERCEAPDAEPSQARSHVGLRWALVDQQRALRDLDQDRIALAHVEKRDPQALGWRKAPLRPERPARPDERHDERRSDDARPEPRGRPYEDRGEDRQPADQREHEPRAHLCERKTADEARTPGQVRGDPPVHPGERSRGLGKHRPDGRRRQPEAEDRRHRRLAHPIREHGENGH
jgi:hypothetical protein